jgi:hypothetical protein
MAAYRAVCSAVATPSATASCVAYRARILDDIFSNLKNSSTCACGGASGSKTHGAKKKEAKR